MQTRRLGRGISALIRETTEEPVGTDSILHLPLKLISPNLLNLVVTSFHFPSGFISTDSIVCDRSAKSGAPP